MKMISKPLMDSIPTAQSPSYMKNILLLADDIYTLPRWCAERLTEPGE